jgi:hypothetical protein
VCGGYVHVTAGADANYGILNDYLIFDQRDKQWVSLKVKKGKFEQEHNVVDALYDGKPHPIQIESPRTSRTFRSEELVQNDDALGI